MPGSNTRTGDEPGTQQPPRVRSFLGRVWSAVLHLLCIRGDNDGAAGTKGPQAATQTDNNNNRANLKDQDDTAQKSTLSSGKILSTFDAPGELIQPVSDATCTASLLTPPPSIPSAIHQGVPPVASASLPSTVSLPSYLFTSTSSTHDVSPGEAISDVHRSSMSAARFMSLTSASRTPMIPPYLFLTPLAFSSDVSGRHFPFGRYPRPASLTSFIPPYLFLSLVSSNVPPGRRIPSVNSASSTSLSTGNGLNPTMLATCHVTSSRHTVYAHASARNLDLTSQHLNQILPQIKLLDATSVSPLAPAVTLGKGSFGSVDLMTSNIAGNNNLVAVKTSFATNCKTNNNAWNLMCLEARVMVLLSGLPSFPSVYGVYREGNKCKMILEFVGDSAAKRSITLLDVLVKRTPAIAPLECALITSEVANAISEMHTRGLLHNDVAARNVLLHHDGTRFTATLTDFGMVSCLQQPRRGIKHTFTSQAERDQFLLSCPEIAPEIIMGGNESVRSDIYALGHLIQLLSSRVCKNNDFSQLGNACHAFNPDHRPNLDQVIHQLKFIADAERAAIFYLGPMIIF